MTARTLPLALLPLVAVLSCGSTEPITSCDPTGGARPYCGFQNPEDLALLPDGRHLLVSEYGGGRGPGRISQLDTVTGERRVLFAGALDAPAGVWGSPACPGPPTRAFSPHGIHLDRRGDGRLQLLVVQHGGRESVEMFEVLHDGTSWQLVWRGCVEAPSGSSTNDVVALPEGGFLVTEMVSGGAVRQVFAYAMAGLFGSDTGRVLQWRPAQGFSELPGSRGAVPNGIELSADGEKVFLNLTFGRVVRIDRRTGTVEADAEIAHPDNSTWAPDGRLLVASLGGSIRGLLACRDIARGACPLPFAIVALDPETMATETVYEGGPGTPGGAGTVGLQVDGALWIGTFAGDRLVRIAIEDG